MITAVALTVAAVVAAFSFRNDEKMTDPMPVQMVDSNNQPVALEDFKGKVLFVNNWASWCPPCIAEMPSIAGLKKKLEGTEVEFLMVSFDEDKSKAKAFMTRRKFDFDVYFPGKEYPFITSSIPATFIVDKTGKTVAGHIGMTDYNSDGIVGQLKALANE